MIMEAYLESLNPEQLEAVTSTEGYVRVVAGAGSGKTKALSTPVRGTAKSGRGWMRADPVL